MSGLHELWRIDPQPYPGGVPVQGPLVSGEGVHVFDGCSVVLLDRRTGQVRWSHPFVPAAECGFASDQNFHPGELYRAGDDVTFAWWSLCGTTCSHYESWALRAATGDAGPEVDDSRMVVAARGSTVVLRQQAPNGLAWAGPLDSPDQQREMALGAEPFGFDPTMLTLGTDKVFTVGPGTMATTPGDPTTAGLGIRAYSVDESRPGCSYLIADVLQDVECPLWVVPLSGTVAGSHPVLDPDGSRVYVTTRAGAVVVVDASTGAVLWQGSSGTNVPVGGPALAHGKLYVPTSDGRVLAYAAAGCGAATCDPLFELATGSTTAIAHKPAIGGQVLFAASADGTLRAFDTGGCGQPSCPPLWTSTALGPLTGAPAVGDGRLYVGLSDAVVAFGL